MFLPAALMMIPLAWWLLLRVFPPEMEHLPFSETEVRKALEEKGSLTGSEMKTMAVFLVTIALWLFSPFLRHWSGGSISLPIEAVALLGGLSLFLPRVGVLVCPYFHFCFHSNLLE